MSLDKDTFQALICSPKFLQKISRPLLVLLDHQRKVVRCEGDYDYYGLPDPYQVDAIEEWLPALVGFDLQLEQSIEMLNLDNGKVVDFNLFNEAGLHALLLTDATHHHSEQQAIQQTRNEVVLLNSQLQLMRLELEHKNHRLEIANAAKSRFIAAMSHEFRTPILGMLGNVEKLRQQLPEAALNGADNTLKTLESNANYLLGLVENLLQQQVIESNSLRIYISQVNLQQLMLQLQNTLTPLVDRKPIRFDMQLNFDPSLVVEMDESNLKRVLFNVIGNAIKFTDEGRVVVNVSYSDEKVHVVIEDTGIGIPEEDLNILYLPFKRGSNAGLKPGAGLGLAHVIQIVQALNGDIDMSSRMTEGTRVTINLPARHVAGSREAPDGAGALTGEGVLMVEDNQDLIDLYNYFFSLEGISMATAKDSRAALELLSAQETPPALIYVDYLLGDELGIDLVSKLRQSGYRGKVVMLTASLDVDDNLREKALQSGCDDFRQKPSNVHDLIQHARQAGVSKNI